MRLLLLLFIILPVIVFSQQEMTIVTLEKPTEIIESYDAFHPSGCCPGAAPMFPGGHRAMQNFFRVNFILPRVYMLYDSKGKKVYVEFIINADGSLSNFEVVKGISSEIDQEVVNVLMKMPKWEVGRGHCMNGRKLVRIPVEIEIL